MEKVNYNKLYLKALIKPFKDMINVAKLNKPKKKSLAKLLAVPIIAFGLSGCGNKPQESQAPNLGVVEYVFYDHKEGEYKIGQAYDVDEDRKVDGVLASDAHGKEFLAKYKKGYKTHFNFKEYFVEGRSELMPDSEVDHVSEELRKNNKRVHQDEMIDKINKEGYR